MDAPIKSLARFVFWIISVSTLASGCQHSALTLPSNSPTLETSLRQAVAAGNRECLSVPIPPPSEPGRRGERPVILLLDWGMWVSSLASFPSKIRAHYRWMESERGLEVIPAVGSVPVPRAWFELADRLGTADRLAVRQSDRLTDEWSTRFSETVGDCSEKTHSSHGDTVLSFLAAQLPETDFVLIHAAENLFRGPVCRWAKTRRHSGSSNALRGFRADLASGGKALREIADRYSVDQVNLSLGINRRILRELTETCAPSAKVKDRDADALLDVINELIFIPLQANERTVLLQAAGSWSGENNRIERSNDLFRRRFLVHFYDESPHDPKDHFAVQAISHDPDLIFPQVREVSKFIDIEMNYPVFADAEGKIQSARPTAPRFSEDGFFYFRLPQLSTSFATPLAGAFLMRRRERLARDHSAKVGDEYWNSQSAAALVAGWQSLPHPRVVDAWRFPCETGVSGPAGEMIPCP